MELWSFSQNSLQILISFLALSANEKLLQSKVANYFWSNTDALIFNCRAKKSYWSVLEKTFFSTEFNHGMKCPYKPQGGQSVHPFGKYITLFPLPGKQVVRCSISASWVTGFLAEFIAEMAKQRISPSGINWDWLMGDILIGDTSPAERQFPSKQFVKTQPLVTHIHTHTFTPTHTPLPWRSPILCREYNQPSTLKCVTATATGTQVERLAQNSRSFSCLHKENLPLKPELSLE